MIALQYCIGFCHTTMWISHSIHMSPPFWTSLDLLPHPTPLSSLLYSNFPLAIYFTYGTIYVSMLLSQFVPTSPPSTVSRVCSLCLCQDMEATWMPTDWWMDKEVVVHIYSEILLSHKGELIWVSSSELDEPRACYTEWSKS